MSGSRALCLPRGKLEWQRDRYTYHKVRMRHWLVVHDLESFSEREDYTGSSVSY